MQSKTILDYYNQAKNTPSDINEHLETLYKLSLKCDHITEMGVRGVVTTWAFLLARPKTLVSIDIQSCPVQPAAELARKNGVNFQFRIGDTGHPDFHIETTDLLFLDTWHIYNQLKQELRLHSGFVKKYIAIHDTTTFGYQRSGEEYDCFVKSGPEPHGLIPAIWEFLADNPEWQVRNVYIHNNGLTILQRAG